MADMEAWLRKLRAEAPGAATAVSIERGKVTGPLNAHALAFSGPRLRETERLRDGCRWWWWGQMRIQPFRPSRVGGKSRQRGGAASYAVKEPEHVELRIAARLRPEAAPDPGAR